MKRNFSICRKHHQKNVSIISAAEACCPDRHPPLISKGEKTVDANSATKHDEKQERGLVGEGSVATFEWDRLPVDTLSESSQIL